MARSGTVALDDVAVRDAEVLPVPRPASREYQPSNGFFRAVLIGLGLSVPFWAGVAWLLSRIL